MHSILYFHFKTTENYSLLWYFLGGEGGGMEDCSRLFFGLTYT